MSKKPTKKNVPEPEIPPAEEIPEPVPVVEEIPPEFNENQQRVLFQKLPIKKIVSYHSGTILADPEPVIEVSDEKYQQILAVFKDHANAEGLISSESLKQIVIKLNKQDIQYDMNFLQTIIDKYLQKTLEEFPLPSNNNENSSNLSNTVSENSPPTALLLPQAFLIQFYLKFFASSYYYGQRLRLFASRGELASVKELIHRGCSLNTANGEGLTTLHYACENNQVGLINLLASLTIPVDSSAVSPRDPSVTIPPPPGVTPDPALWNLNARDKYGWTPLHTACHHGHLPVVMKLLSFGVVNSSNNNNNKTGGIHLNERNSVGKTALHISVMQNRSTMVSQLLTSSGRDRGALLNSRDRRGMTVIHEAAYRGHLPLYQELIREKEADLSIRDALGKLAGDYWNEEYPVPAMEEGSPAGKK
jgi:ankyrin repeat protein